MTAAALVRSAIRLSLPSVWAASRSMWTAPLLGSRYPAYLGALHWLIRASVPLMETAAGRCAELAVTDPVAAPLARYLAEHIIEERGHDAWLLEDLAVLGAGWPLELPGPAEREHIAALAGTQYYLIRHVHPACLIGYIAVLEGCPPDPVLTGRLPRLTGLPPAAFRTLAWHASRDPGHYRDLDQLLGTLPLSPPVAAAVARNAAYTARASATLLTWLAGENARRTP